MPPKKKKRKPRSRARGANATPTAPKTEQAAPVTDRRRERLDARREAKAKALIQQRRRQKQARIVRTIAIVGALAGIVWFLFLRGGVPDEIAGNEVNDYDLYLSESRAGTLHRGDPVSTESVPPVSGPHDPGPANCGTYAAQIPDPNMVHTLEHGGVGIAFSPDTPPEDIAAIETLVQSYDSHVFSEPYERMDSQITVLAWGHSMPMDSYDENAVKEFIDLLRAGGDAPEANQDCPTTSDDKFQPTPTASPTSGAEETPAPAESPDKKEKKED